MFNTVYGYHELSYFVQGDRERLCGGDPLLPGHRGHHDWQVRGGEGGRAGQDQQVCHAFTGYLENV